jgi:hypothetical protein
MAADEGVAARGSGHPPVKISPRSLDLARQRGDSEDTDTSLKQQHRTLPEHVNRDSKDSRLAAPRPGSKAPHRVAAPD